MKLRFKAYDWQKEVAFSRAQFRLVIVGRRAGKTALNAIEAIAAATRGQRVWIVAPIYKIAKENWLYLERFLAPAPVKLNKSELIATFPITGNRTGTIELRTAVNARNLRGAGLDLLIVEEAAHIPAGKSLWENVLLPTLLDRNGRALFSTTPLGLNWIHDLYTRAQRDASGEWETWHLPSTVSPHITPEKLERLKRNMSDRAFRQEFLAEFLPDGGVIFPYVSEIIDPEIDITQTRRLAGHNYAMGVDWAKEDDRTAIVVMDIQAKRVVDIVQSQQDYDLQIMLIKKLYLKWRPDIIVAETNAMGAPQIDHLRAQGLPVIGFATTMQSKKLLIDELALAIRTREIRIPPHKELTDQLNAYTTIRLPSGRERYTAPNGMHDDLVMALAFAYHGVMEDNGEGVLFVA